MTSLSPKLRAPFVSSDAGALRAAAFIRPLPSIAFAQPVPGEPNAIAQRASEQLAVFVHRLHAAGVQTIELDGAVGGALSPGCADGAVIFPAGAFLMRPSDVRARTALAALEGVFKRAGIPAIGRIEAPALLDGGDVLLGGDTVYLGVSRARGDEVGIPWNAHGNVLGREQLAAYARAQGFKVVDVLMAGEARRLRSVASFVSKSAVVVASGIVDASAFEGVERIDVPRGEDYAAGMLALGNRRVIVNLRFRETIPLLRKANVAVEAVDLWEFGKLGITPSSLILALKRD